MFTIKRFDGPIWTFDTLEDAVRHIGGEVMSFKGHFRRREVDYGGPFDFPFYDRFQVRDDLGFIVKPDVLCEVYNKLPRLYSHRWWKSFRGRALHLPEHFRRLPVPGTGHSRRRGNYYRSPGTLQECRENDALFYDDDMIEYDIKPRAKRARSILPNSYDDLVNDSCQNRSWKQSRKTKWK